MTLEEQKLAIKSLSMQYALLKTVDESKESVLGGVPESYLYLALGCDLLECTNLVGFLRDKGVLNSTSNLLTPAKNFGPYLKKIEDLVTKIGIKK